MEIIQKYFQHTTDLQTHKFGKLGELYKHWNEQINVISRKDIDSLYERHVLHSLAIAKIISFGSSDKILDVGTGGGFPGIPLAILFPEAQFTLIDSIGKKIKVVNEIVSSLNLKNVIAKQIRSNELKQKFNFVVSRAVTEFPKFVTDVKHLISPNISQKLKNGIIYLKGGDFSNELASFKPNVQIFDIEDYFKEDFFKEKKIIYLPF